MAEEKTLLEQVHETEVALAAEYARACVEADAARETAEGEARATVEGAELKGREEAEARYRREMDGLEREIDRLRADARLEQDVFRSAGEGRLTQVADDLVDYVAPV